MPLWCLGDGWGMFFERGCRGLLVLVVFLCESLLGGVGGARASTASQVLLLLGLGLRVKKQALSGLLSTPDLEPPCGCPVWVVAVVARCGWLLLVAFCGWLCGLGCWGLLLHVGWLVWLVGVWLVGCW